ncbi:hypothetical protein FACS189452_08440 [Bacteroidia bacterium]|nr:hypothetical protein FACS189452_08440 [Bacteroidia bacterium]
MIEKIEQYKLLQAKYNIPFEDVVAMDLNLSGVATDLHSNRVRISLYVNNQQSLLFSLENNTSSLYNIKNRKLFFKDICLFDISDIKEDTCEVFYTRKNDKVLCFNPNNRSSCKGGCRFCYQPMAHDTQYISSDMLLNTFKEWLQNNNFPNLSHLEQIAVITGCFPTEQIVVEFLLKLREVTQILGFRNEILYFGIISNLENIKILSKIKPFKICFTVECFENRDIILSQKKNLELPILIALMDKAIENGIITTFSYVLGLDSVESFKENMVLLKNYINSFPVISLFQTDNIREKYKHKEALNIEYYLKCRKYIEKFFADTNLKPNSWNNYRSLWRTCYNGESIINNK